jgi:hypothetical protein
MKRRTLFEIAAALLAFAGVFGLVAVFMPVLNPGFWALRGADWSGRDAVLMATVPGGMIGLAWALNRKAQGMKERGE